MNIEMTGKVSAVLQEVTGTGRNGVWVKQPFVLETEGQFPKMVHFEAWSDKADIVKNLRKGEQVRVSFEPESREFNGKWYTSLRAWRIERVAAGGGSSEMPPSPSLDDMPSMPSDNMNMGDLPF
jgi:hypothetical protein